MSMKQLTPALDWADMPFWPQKESFFDQKIVKNTCTVGKEFIQVHFCQDI